MSGTFIAITRDKMSFITWLEQELEERRWKKTDLAAAAGLSHSALSLVVAGERNPGPDLCNGIARAFGISPEKVFRIAGLLPPLPEEDDELARQLVENFKRLSLEQRREVVSYVFWKIRESRSEDTPKLDGRQPGQSSLDSEDRGSKDRDN